MMPHLAGSQHRVAPATVIGPAVVSGMALAGPPCPAAFPSTKPSPDGAQIIAPHATTDGHDAGPSSSAAPPCACAAFPVSRAPASTPAAVPHSTRSPPAAAPRSGPATPHRSTAPRR